MRGEGCAVGAERGDRQSGKKEHAIQRHPPLAPVADVCASPTAMVGARACRRGERGGGGGRGGVVGGGGVSWVTLPTPLAAPAGGRGQARPGPAGGGGRVTVAATAVGAGVKLGRGGEFGGVGRGGGEGDEGGGEGAAAHTLGWGPSMHSDLNFEAEGGHACPRSGG